MLSVNEPAAFAPHKSYEPLLHVSVPIHNCYLLGPSLTMVMATADR
jgi:hypothetical protein